MDDKNFATLATDTLAQIETALESSGVDLDFELQSGGILQIEFADGSQIIVNRHAAAQEIWVAARAGGFHFRYDGSVWKDSRDGEELMSKLSRLATEQAGQSVNLLV